MAEDESWSIATGEDDGKPLIIRIRTEVPSFVRKADFPHLMAVTWTYEPNRQGMPSSEDLDRMTELENLLYAGIEEVGQAFTSVVVTGNGAREWQWYARDPDVIMDLVNKTLGELEPFPVDFNFQDDPDWEGYQQFLDILDSQR